MAGFLARNLGQGPADSVEVKFLAERQVADSEMVGSFAAGQAFPIAEHFGHPFFALLDLTKQDAAVMGAEIIADLLGFKAVAFHDGDIKALYFDRVQAHPNRRVSGSVNFHGFLTIIF